MKERVCGRWRCPVDAPAREAKGRYGSCDGLIQLDFWRRFGVSVTDAAQRLGGYRPENVEVVEKAPEHLKRSSEEGIDLVGCLVGNRSMVTNVNVPNLGQSPAESWGQGDASSPAGIALGAHRCHSYPCLDSPT